MRQARAISAAFPFASHYVGIPGSRMHYVDEPGDGPLTFLFLHGNPASSYLWRNVIPYVRPLGRAVAPDLIGMGRSDKPPLSYSFLEHADYLEVFIERLGLTDVVLVMQDWGGGLGFDYACRHPSNVRGLAFMECLTGPRRWSDLTVGERLFFMIVRSALGRWLVIRRNFWIERFLPLATGRALTDEEMQQYRAPFRDPASREPLLRWPREMPLDGPSEPGFARMDAYARWLRTSATPKLLLWSEPGMVIGERVRRELVAHVPNMKAVKIGPGKHYLPEEHPHEVGEAIVEWVQATFAPGARHAAST